MNHLRLIRAPDYVYAHSNKGLALTCLGGLQAKLSRRDGASKIYPQAIAAFDEALYIAPDHVQIYNNRANVLKSLGELQTRLSQRDEASSLEGERMPTTHCSSSDQMTKR